VHEELDLAADILENFKARWDACHANIERVCVGDDKVVALTLPSNDHLMLGHKTNEPTFVEVDPMVYEWALRDLDTHMYVCSQITCGSEPKTTKRSRRLRQTNIHISLSPIRVETTTRILFSSKAGAAFQRIYMGNV
jgi:hypothetical protein